MWWMAYDKWHMIYDIWNMIYGIWYMTYDIWHKIWYIAMVQGIWPMVHGTRHMAQAYDIWPLAYGIFICTVHNEKYLVKRHIVSSYKFTLTYCLETQIFFRLKIMGCFDVQKTHFLNWMLVDCVIPSYVMLIDSARWSYACLVNC